MLKNSFTLLCYHHYSTDTPLTKYVSGKCLFKTQHSYQYHQIWCKICVSLDRLFWPNRYKKLSHNHALTGWNQFFVTTTTHALFVTKEAKCVVKPDKSNCRILPSKISVPSLRGATNFSQPAGDTGREYYKNTSTSTSMYGDYGRKKRQQQYFLNYNLFPVLPDYP